MVGQFPVGICSLKVGSAPTVHGLLLLAPLSKLPEPLQELGLGCSTPPVSLREPAWLKRLQTGGKLVYIKCFN